jgi:hypothetical protein
MKRHLTFANVAAALALFFALGGSAVAARHYLINSTSQINPKVLRELRGANGHNGAAGAPGQLGAQGPAGASGAPGTQGPAGPVNLSGIQLIEGQELVGSGVVGGPIAYCPPGTRAISGGGNVGMSASPIGAIETARGREGWFVLISNHTGFAVSVGVQVLCAGSGQAVAASSHHQLEAAYAAAKARLGG